jgi:hypothetical protein
MWVITLGYFLAYPWFGPTIEVIYRPPISYIAVFSWIFGNFLFLYYYMLGCAKRNQWDLMKYIFMVPFYWGMMSTAAGMALYQLIFKPHYWEKTQHGFHLGTPQPAPAQVPVTPLPRPAYVPSFDQSAPIVAKETVNQPVAAQFIVPPSFAQLKNNISQFIASFRVIKPRFSLYRYSRQQQLVSCFHLILFWHDFFCQLKMQMYISYCH